MKYEFERFHFRNLDMLKEKLAALRLDLPVAEELDALRQPVTVGGSRLKNALAVHPMEGCDANPDGSPSDLVYRRYERFAKGGSGLLWVEACAVCHEGRANPRQLYINKDNVQAFQALAAHIRKNATGEVYLVLQLTHSGRYSKPGGDLPAVVACENKYLDSFLPPHVRTITDEELSELENAFVQAAQLARQAGFDAVDVKCCHRYLNNELLSAYGRDGQYGGSFENRTRFLFHVVEKIGNQVPIDLAVRLNAYDEIPYPYGFGVDPSDHRVPALSETEQIVRRLQEYGVKLINITGGNPYYNPHVNRPYDTGGYTPPSHPLEHVYKLLDAARQVKACAPDVKVVATGFTWLRELAANVAAGCIRDGWFDIAGFGRQAFAYPDFANDILSNGGMRRQKCCITCGKCSLIMRDGGMAGCVIRDSEVYLPIYSAGRQGKPEIDGSRKAEHN